jgi:uncharacterized metal-binding protein
MSNYKTHVVFNLLVGLPAAIVGMHYTLHPSSSLLITFIVTFFYGTCFMSPDLDLVHKIKLRSIRGICSLPFRLYSKFFKHRGLSHSFLFGTLTRVLWLSAVGFIIFFAIYQTFPTQKSILLYFKQHKLYIYYALAGVTMADWCHLILDYRKGKIFKKI